MIDWNGKPHSKDSPAWPRGRMSLACIPLVISGIFYGIWLDRYPVPYQDESFYTAPAVSLVCQKVFAHPTRTDAPYSGRLWAYHGPLYSRLLVPVFQIFGISIAAARAPQFIAAYLAVFLLCAWFFRRGWNRSAVVLMIAWLGDRSQQEILYARMEGLCLLCLVVGFWGLLSTRWYSLVAAGAALVASCGFHPMAMFFVAAGAIWAMARGWRAVGKYALGAILAGAAVLAAFGPDTIAAAEQFLWHADIYAEKQPSITNNIRRLLSVLNWSSYWGMAVVVVSAGLSCGVVISAIRQRQLIDTNPAARLAALFAGCGLLGFVLLARCAFPYNLVILTVWPVVALAAWEPRKNPSGIWFHGSMIILFIAWLPSGAWNLMRAREIAMYARLMDPEPAREVIRTAIPPDQTVGVDKYVGLFGWTLQRPAVLLPWHQADQYPPAQIWLLISEIEYETHEQLAREALAHRPVVLETTLYSPACPINQKLILLGPARAVP